VSGEHALAAVERCAPDLILLDVFLPDTTAVELIPQIKSILPNTRCIPLTGQSSRELERRLRELGITYYMANPFRRVDLQGHSFAPVRPAQAPAPASGQNRFRFCLANHKNERDLL
jgi:response regulator RpfG family c-di-GMP phosphodiesterase